MPANPIVGKILERIGQPNLPTLLAESLTGTELNSLLLEVFHRKAASLSAPELLQQYQRNRFVKPADLSTLELKQMEVDVLKHFQRFGFRPIELSPVAAFGSCSVVAPADQNKILTALRGTEVMADATNAIALHISDLKKTKQWTPESLQDHIRFGTIQRHLRTPAVEAKGFTPHFKIGCLVSSGIDTGSYSFEKKALSEHIAAMYDLYTSYYNVDRISFRFLCRSGYENSVALAERIRTFVVDHQPHVEIEIVERPPRDVTYYKGIQYKIDIHVKGNVYEIGDGGFVDWTQQLLQNKKERMFTTGIGFDFMFRIMLGQL